MRLNVEQMETFAEVSDFSDVSQEKTPQYSHKCTWEFQKRSQQHLKLQSLQSKVSNISHQIHPELCYNRIYSCCLSTVA